MELKEGEVQCSECHGSGNRAKWNQIPDYKCYLMCDKCNGKGKMDWIEAVVGVKPEPNLKLNFTMQYGMKMNLGPNLGILSNCAS